MKSDMVSSVNTFASDSNISLLSGNVDWVQLTLTDIDGIIIGDTAYSLIGFYSDTLAVLAGTMSSDEGSMPAYLSNVPVETQ